MLIDILEDTSWVVISGRSENDSFELLELKLNLEGNMADKIQNAYETSKNIYDDVLTQEIFLVNCILSYFGVALMIMI